MLFQLPIMQVIFSLPHHMLLSVHHVRDMHWLSPSSLSTCCSRPSYGAAPGGPLCSWKESLISVILEQLWGFRHSWWRRTLGLDQIIAIGSVFDGATLGLTPPTPGIEQFWPFKYTRRPPTLGLTPPYTRPDPFWAIIAVFDGSTLGLTPPIHPPEPVLAHHHCA